MDGKTSQSQKEMLWPSIISIIVPLVQLMIVVSVGLSSTLSFQRFFFLPEILSIVNILIVFITLSLIGLFWYWKNNSFLLNFTSSHKKENNKRVPVSVTPSHEKENNKRAVTPEQKVFKYMKILLVISFLAFSIFIGVIIVFLTGQLIMPIVWMGIIQYLSYSFFLIFTGLILYIWISEYARKRQVFQREDFVRNLSNALGEHGLIPSPEIKIWRNQPNPGWMTKYVELGIDGKRYVVITSFDGLEISEIYKKEEHEELTNPSKDPV